MAVGKESLGFLLFNFLKVIMEDYRLLIKLVRLLKGLK